MGLDENLCLLLPEMYMEHSLGSLIIANIPRHPALFFKDRVAFDMAWPKMEPCFHFLMGWRKIAPVVGHGWLVNYLKIHKAYIHPVVTFENLDIVNFYTPNIEKTSREKSSFEFPHFFKEENPSDVVKVIMIY